MSRIFKAFWLRWLATELSSGGSRRYTARRLSAPPANRPIVGYIHYLGAIRWRRDMLAMGTVRKAPNPPHRRVRTDRPG